MDTLRLSGAYTRSFPDELTASFAVFATVCKEPDAKDLFGLFHYVISVCTLTRYIKEPGLFNSGL